MRARTTAFRPGKGARAATERKKALHVAHRQRASRAGSAWQAIARPARRGLCPPRTFACTPQASHAAAARRRASRRAHRSVEPGLRRGLHVDACACSAHSTESALLAVRPGARVRCPHCKEQHTKEKSSLQRMCARHRLQKGIFVGPPSRAPHKKNGVAESRTALPQRARAAVASERAREGRARAGGRARAASRPPRWADADARGPPAPRVSYLLGSAERVLHHICVRA